MKTVLLLVHPGSCCGSADFNLGGSHARSLRKELIAHLERWQGDVLVMDGALSDELPRYQSLDRAIGSALQRAPEGYRVFACDDVGVHFTKLLPRILRESPWADPAQARFELTGAWYDPENTSGCVNACRAVLTKLGFDCEISDSAFAVAVEAEA